MIANKKIIAIIPARGGSKGLPHKNIKILEGKPLLAWSITTALSSKYIDEVCVSSDDEKIRKLGRKHGAQTPFVRPSILAQDTSPTMDAIFHTLDYYQQNLKQNFDIIVCLQPTSPFRETEDVDDALELLINNENAWSVASVTQTDKAALFATINQKYLKWTFGAPNNMRRQDKKEQFYCLNGSIMLSWTSKLRQEGGFYHSNTLPLVMPKSKSLDIDDALDWKTAKAIAPSALNTKYSQGAYEIP